MKESVTNLCKKNETAIKNALGRVGQTRIADLVGLSDTTISRWKDNDAEKVAGILAAAGLMVVSEDTPDIDAGYLAALEYIARRAIPEHR